MKRGGLVIDSMGEIFEEYCRGLSLKGQPGIGDKFVKWVHDNQWKLPSEDSVDITKVDHSYKEFPKHKDLDAFDRSDRKFIAVAYKHPKRPPIIQAADSKWWGYRKVLASCGITVRFVCEQYVVGKYEKKMAKRKVTK